MLAERKRDMALDALPVQISAPAIQQAKLSFCDDGLDDFESWAKALPMANLGAAAKHLFLATKELSQVQMSGAQRYKRLEIIRSKTYSVGLLLSKRFTNQAIPNNETDRKVAHLNQALYSQLAAGYKQVVLAEWQSADIKKKPPTKLFSFAIHRAMADTAQALLKAFQFYQSPPAKAWYDIHQLYLLAEQKDLVSYTLKDEQARYLSSSSIKDLYVRTLLLGSLKTNQYRQQDLALLYDATELWCTRARMLLAKDPYALFSVDLDQDQGPVYLRPNQSNVRRTQRALDTRALVAGLQAALKKAEGAATIPGHLSEPVVRQAISNWGTLIERAFRRTSGEGSLQIGMGITGCHFFLCGGHSFSHLLNLWMPAGLPKDKKKVHPNDAWAHSFDAGNHNAMEADTIEFDANRFMSKHQKTEIEDTGPKSPIVETQIINTCPGGYCIALQALGQDIQTGEIIVVREPDQQNWSLAVVRWLKSTSANVTHVGLELLAPKASAIGIRILNKTGENGEFLRGLVLPELPAVGQPQTLIVPTMPFKVGCKAEIIEGEHIHRVQLLSRINTTGSFVQYSYRSITSDKHGYGAPAKADQSSKSTAPVSSFWDHLN